MNQVLFAASLLFGFLHGLASASEDDDITTLIDQLAEVAEPGFGYSGTFAGSNFLPYADSEQLNTLVLGAAYREPSAAMLEIVRRGLDAVPKLLEHMDDGRPIKLPALSGMMWMEYGDEYDCNWRTREHPPDGVNEDWFGKDNEPLRSHQVTVGDLCFVALGQIVNRNFAAARYQPTGGIIISSPSSSKPLTEVVRNDWAGLTRDQHLQGLIDDFKLPDDHDRRVGAYYRLAFYYPEVVEDIILHELAKKTYDRRLAGEFVSSEQFVAASTPEERTAALDAFVVENGSQYAVGVQLSLLEQYAKAYNNGVRLSAASKLRDLFGIEDARVALRRPFEATSVRDRWALIEHLTHDDSRRIGDLVQQEFVAHADDEYFSEACLRCLANRGYGPFLVEQLKKIDLHTHDTDDLHLRWLWSIADSRDPLVAEELKRIVLTTTNDVYFFTAVEAVEDVDDVLVHDRAVAILRGLPEFTESGAGLLTLFIDRYPDEAAGALRDFLKPDSRSRALTVCEVLWYGHPLSAEILRPLLDDERDCDGFTIPMRVCDRAAQALSHTIESIRFDSDWSRARKDEGISQLKAYCDRVNRASLPGREGLLAVLVVMGAGLLARHRI